MGGFSGSSKGSGLGRIAEQWADYNEGRATKERNRIKNTAFQNDAFVSFHTAVGRYHEGVNGKKFVLFTNFKYSVTTSQHISGASSAPSVPVFIVPKIDFNTPKCQAENIEYLHGLLTSAVESSKRSWNRRYEDTSEYCYRGSIKYVYENLVDYAQLTGNKIKNLEHVDAIIKRVVEHRLAKQMFFDNPKEVARRERERARRIAKEALGID